MVCRESFQTRLVLVWLLLLGEVERHIAGLRMRGGGSACMYQQVRQGDVVRRAFAFDVVRRALFLESTFD